MDQFSDLTRKFEVRKALADIADYIMCKMHRVPPQEQPERLKRFITKTAVPPYLTTDQTVVNEAFQPLADIIAGQTVLGKMRDFTVSAPPNVTVPNIPSDPEVTWLDEGVPIPFVKVPLTG